MITEIWPSDLGSVVIFNNPAGYTQQCWVEEIESVAGGRWADTYAGPVFLPHEGWFRVKVKPLQNGFIQEQSFWALNNQLTWAAKAQTEIQLQPETKGMNYSIAALLLNPDKCRAIMTTYDVDPTDDTKPRVKRELKKSFDPNIKNGDLVIVPTNTRHKFTVVKVVAVDVDWEPDTSEQVDWIVGVVNTDGYLDLQKQEAEMIALAKESEKTAKRNDLKDKMFKHVNQDQINSLQITSAGPKTIEGSGS